MSRKRTSIALPLVLVVALGGCAAMPRSDQGQVSASAAITDGVSTHIAVASGAVEKNPLINPSPAGLLAVTALKIGLSHVVDGYEDPEARRIGHNSMSAFWGGATANNILVAMGAAPAVAVVAGIGAGYRACSSNASRPLRAGALTRSGLRTGARSGVALQEIDQ